jgi:outer membrane receptor protein involved in Fe transport
LSPFEVSSTRDTGYQATETLAGTRIRTDLKDVSASISVINKTFMDDIGATDSATLLQYTTNTEVAGTLGTYAGLGNGQSIDESGSLRAPAGAQRVRGLAAADNARDYYITDIPWDSFNVDRIDILRGPNSILYGLGSPAGIINASTRNAEFRNTGEVKVRTGSYGSVRSSLDLNQVLIPNVLAIRVDGLWNNQKYEQDPAFQDDKRVYGTVRFEPKLFKRSDFRTSIKAKFENGDIKANRPRIIPPNDSITPWFRPQEVSATNPFGGMGKTLVNNPYDPWRTNTPAGSTDTTPTVIVPGDGLGLTQSSTVNYQPWLSDFPNQQQPYWLIDGTTNQLYAVNGGYINNGAVTKDGVFTGISGGLMGKGTNGMFYGLTGLPGAVTNAHNANSAAFPDAQYGQYRTMTLLDPTVFDFYNTLIDGPTKKEWEKWNTYNVDLSQTAFDDRIGFQFTVDRQKYNRGGESFLSGNPTITVDVLKNFLDYYTKGSDGVNDVTNPNLGRPYVSGAGSAGGSSYLSDRKYTRASLFGELRASDFFQSEFLVKLLGKQRFNGVASDEKFYNENKRWQNFANSQQWAGYWNGNDGSSSAISDRAPLAFVYLGSSVLNRDSASGANIPGITSPVTLQDSGVYVFDTTWKNYATSYDTPWTVPASMSRIYDSGNPPTPSGGAQYDQWYQNSNPANYVGWNSNVEDKLLRYNDGENDNLLTLAQKSLRQTKSYSGSWQGFFWNNALVATMGWRYDEVKTKDVTAKNQTLNRSSLNLQPDVYRLPDEFPLSQIVKGHSTSGGVVLHLNNILKRDPLPIDVTVGYNESSNFQVTSVRRDVYGNPIDNPTGKTREYSVLLSTKDGKYSFRAVKYTTRAFNATSSLGNNYVLGQVVAQGLRWRNVFLYDLGGYDWGSREQPSYRNTWSNAYPLNDPADSANYDSTKPAFTQAQADAEENAAITGWNNIQKHLAEKNFFSAWNFTPLNDAALVDRATYLSNPSAYAPDAATVSAYASAVPQGFSVTADTESKGYEFELTANPLANWRVSFSASKAEATQTNVGGASLSDFVSYLNSQLINDDGTLTPAGKLPQFGGASNAIYPNIWGPWLASYTLLKLQEGSANPEIRKWRYNIVTNYQFRHGFLKGVSVGASYRWQDKVIIGYPVLTGGSFAGYDLSNPYYGPTEDAVDLSLSYERKLTEKINWKIQLNVYNVGKNDKLIPISIEPDGKTWASARIAPVQEWQLTNTFSF